MNTIKLDKYRVPEKDYLKHITGILQQIPADKKAILFFLCKKLAKYEDDEGKNILIAYESGSTDAKEAVLGWATEISSEHFFLPPLMVKYMVASMETETFIRMCKMPAEQIEDPDLRFAIIRYKDEINYMALHSA